MAILVADGDAWQDGSDEDVGDDDLVPAGLVGVAASDEEGVQHDDAECVIGGDAPGERGLSPQDPPGDAAEPAAEPDLLTLPSLRQYKQKWDQAKARHTKSNDDIYSHANLVPRPCSALMQDVPWVPFDLLQSSEAQCRLSVVKPSGTPVKEPEYYNGVEHFPKKFGLACPRRRSAEEAHARVVATRSCVLNAKDRPYKGLSRLELEAWHECLSWLRVPGNNQFVSSYMTNYERLADLWDKLGEELVHRELLPQGGKRAQIRMVPKHGPNAMTGELGETLGHESVGLVQVETNDAGRVRTMGGYDALGGLDYDQELVVEIRRPTADGKSWRQRPSVLDTSECEVLGSEWRRDLASGAKAVVEHTWVDPGDAHFDAKAHPVSHPYGTGSAYSQFGSGGLSGVARNRLGLVQSWFRRSATWIFQMYERLSMNQLYQQNKHCCNDRRGSANVAADTDGFQRIFGDKLPSNLPETPAWFRRKQKELFAMADDAELGAFATMTTVTANEWTPEMLAAIRRGPLAAPTEDEMIEYLHLVRHKGDQVVISSAAVKECNGTYLPFGDHNARKKYRNERGAVIYRHGLASQRKPGTRCERPSVRFRRASGKLRGQFPKRMPSGSSGVRALNIELVLAVGQCRAGISMARSGA